MKSARDDWGLWLLIGIWAVGLLAIYLRNGW